MAEYKLDRKDKAFIKGLESFFSLNPEKLTPEEINEINNTPVKTKLARKYLSKSRAKVTVTTYVWAVLVTMRKVSLSVRRWLSARTSICSM